MHGKALPISDPLVLAFYRRNQVVNLVPTPRCLGRRGKFLQEQRESETLKVTKILLDTSAYRSVVTEEVGVCEEIVEVLGSAVTIRLVQKREVKPKSDWHLAQVVALEKLFERARSADVKFGVSWELHQEFCNGTQKRASTRGDLMHGVTIEHVKSPIERSRFFSLPLGEYASKEVKEKFIEILCHFARDVSKFPRLGIGGWPLTEYESDSLQSLPKFAAACKSVPKAQWFDLFHLWTADRAGYRYFLTLDKKFVNVMTQTCKVQFNAIPVVPVDLQKLLSKKLT